MIDSSYGKVLLAPGQRLGYLAVSPKASLNERLQLRQVCFTAQMALGWNFPNALMQYAVPDLETVSIDVGTLQKRRDRIVATLSTAGYVVTAPQGTFDVWAQAPGGANSHELFNFLADSYNVFILPGTLFEVPDHFRICLTANDDMITQSLPARFFMPLLQQKIFSLIYLEEEEEEEVVERKE